MARIVSAARRRMGWRKEQTRAWPFVELPSEDVDSALRTVFTGEGGQAKIAVGRAELVRRGYLAQVEYDRLTPKGVEYYVRAGRKAQEAELGLPAAQMLLYIAESATPAERARHAERHHRTSHQS